MCIRDRIITYNEAPNIVRTVGKLLWAKRIVVIDSGSTDETLDMPVSYTHLDVYKRQIKACGFEIVEPDLNVLSRDPVVHFRAGSSTKRA